MVGDSRAAQHIPVMCERILRVLEPALSRPDAVYLDCTLGLAGHAIAVLREFPHARLIGIDRDPMALQEAERRLGDLAGRATFHESVYSSIADALAAAGVDHVDGALMDLGLSSLQIDMPERGFSYAHDAPLDMRMSPDDPVSAADIVNTWSAKDLERILFAHADERHARRIAAAIVQRRDGSPIERSTDLAQLVVEALPAAVRYAKGGGHPAKRTFQALRIEVNRELDVLADALPAVLDAVGVGGRVAILSYHSLEDRMVKGVFAKAAADSAPPGLPQVPEALRARFAHVTRGAERPDPEEIQANPRAASAKFRAVERVRSSQ